MYKPYPLDACPTNRRGWPKVGVSLPIQVNKIEKFVKLTSRFMIEHLTPATGFKRGYYYSGIFRVNLFFN